MFIIYEKDVKGKKEIYKLEISCERDVNGIK